VVVITIVPELRSDGQPGSYPLAGRVSTDKRASSDQPITGGKPEVGYTEAVTELFVWLLN